MTKIDNDTIDRLKFKIVSTDDLDRLRELALLAIEGWTKAHETLVGIQNIVTGKVV